MAEKETKYASRALKLRKGVAAVALGVGIPTAIFSGAKTESDLTPTHAPGYAANEVNARHRLPFDAGMTALGVGAILAGSMLRRRDDNKYSKMNYAVSHNFKTANNLPRPTDVPPINVRANEFSKHDKFNTTLGSSGEGSQESTTAFKHKDSLGKPFDIGKMRPNSTDMIKSYESLRKIPEGDMDDLEWLHGNDITANDIAARFPKKGNPGPDQAK